MQVKTLNIKKIILKICVYIAIFGSSILGAQIFGISLNKVCLIPLFLHLLFNVKGSVIKKTLFPLLAFYVVGAVSSVISIVAPYADSIDDYYSVSIFYAIQLLFIFIPFVYLFSGYSYKEELLNDTKSAIIFVSRANIIVALIEFFSYFIVGVSFTNAILYVFYKIDNAAALINLGRLGVFLRPSGLNLAPSYLGIIIVFGFIFEEKTIWKLFGFITSLIAMSRTALVILIALFIYKYMKENKLSRIKKRYLIVFFVLIVGLVTLMTSIPSFSSQIEGMLSRLNLFEETKSDDVGTLRHLLYFPKSIEIYLFKYNIIQKLIGFGPRLSGTILAHSNVMNVYLGNEAFNTAWALECDFAELLLGYGILGFCLYYSTVLKLRKISNYGKFLFIAIFLYSFMYNISASTFSQLIIMIFLCCSEESFRKPKENEECQKLV